MMDQHGCTRRRRSETLTALVVVGCLSITLAGCGGNSSPGPAAPPPSGGAPVASAQDPARRVLEEMVAAYRKAQSYSDQGYVHLDMRVGGRDRDQKLPFSVAMVRPNQLRMDLYYASLVSDGGKLRGTVPWLPNQFLTKDAPPPLSMRQAYSDPVLAQALYAGPAGGSPQLLLLLGDDPITILLQTAQKTALLEPAPLGQFTCDRVSIIGPEGTGILWIDRPTRILRRVELPVEEIKKQAEAEGRVERVVITAELANAEFDRPVDPKRFQLDSPPGAQVVKVLVPPDPGQLLSKKVPPFKFTDLAGKPVTPESIAGKIAVIDFWAITCPPCRESLPKLEQVYGKYKANPKVAFLCVSVDPPDTKTEAVTALLKELSVTVSACRETEGQLNGLFLTNGIPVMFLVGSDGVVEDFEAGYNPELTKALPEKLEKLLAGKHLYEQGLKDYQQRLKGIEEVAQRGPDLKPPPAEEVRQELPPAKIAEASQPKSLKLKSLWKCAELKSPGNLLVVPRPGRGPQILVLNEWRSVVELGPDGKVAATHPIELPSSEVVSFLRTTEGAGGRRWFAVSAVGMQQVHVYDTDWKPVFHFPSDAFENKHPGIFDAQFAELAAPGTPLLALGYWGPVGAQGVSLEGKRLWANRSMENVFRLTVTGPDAAGRRSLLCLNSRGTIVVLDAEGNRKEEIVVGSRPIQLLVGADLTGDGQPEFCGMSSKQLGVYVAVGLDLRGKELWTYDLPPGHPAMPIEQIVPGRVLSAPGGQWLLPAAEGSIHILRADGQLIDRFNYGSALSGLATAEINGRPVLLVASGQGVEALEVGQ